MNTTTTALHHAHMRSHPKEAGCVTGQGHIRNTSYQVASVPCYHVPRGITAEVARKFEEWCQRRGIHPPELDEGQWMRGFNYGKEAQ